jgi:hypothetical protein
LIDRALPRAACPGANAIGWYLVESVAGHMVETHLDHQLRPHPLPFAAALRAQRLALPAALPVKPSGSRKASSRRVNAGRSPFEIVAVTPTWSSLPSESKSPSSGEPTSRLRDKHIEQD